MKETLLAVKDAYESNPGRAGIACAMKNAGVGVGLPDRGRAKLVVHNGKIELYSAASDIGQGCKTVFVQMVAETTGLGKDRVINMGANSEVTPDSGTTSGSRQTLITGEAVRMAAADLNKDLQAAGGDLEKLEGKEYFAEFFDPTDKLGADVPNPKSHVACGFATHVVILDDNGRVKEVYAAHDSGKVVNPIAIQGQIEGGVLMGLGYALTEDFLLKDGVPQGKIRNAGPDAGHADPGYPCHLCGERRTASICIRRERHRRDRHDPDRSRGTGRVLCEETMCSGQNCRWRIHFIQRSVDDIRKISGAVNETAPL